MIKRRAPTEMQLIDRWATRRQRTIAFLREKGLRGLLDKARSAGLGGSVAFVNRQFRYQLCKVLGEWWDRKYNVDTSGQIDLVNLEVVGTNRERGHAVVSTSPRMYRFLAQFFPQNWSDFTFVDVGCGKGRVVLLAMMQGFRRIIGIEFAPLVCEVAEGNVSSFRGWRPPLANVSIINADATEVDLPSGVPLLIYCFNPFDAELWKKFVPRLIKTYEINKMPMCVVLSGTVPEVLSLAADRISASEQFRLRAHGVSPSFVDAYLPSYYWVFDASQPMLRC